MKAFFKTLEVQRWDDHRYYHHSRINQTLHFISALCFIASYVMLFFDPASAALLAWGISMTTRQSGHFFFEPRDYDQVNHATHEHKEEIKIGYNLQRKVVLMSLWGLNSTVVLASGFAPTVGGLINPASGFRRLFPQRGHGVVGAWGGWHRVPHGASVLSLQHANRPRLGDQDSD